MKDDILNINIQIGGFRMPLKVHRDDEEFYRAAEKLVVRYVQEFQKRYNQRPIEEIYIMVAYQLAVMISRNELIHDTTPLVDKIKMLDRELEELLNKE